MHDKRFIFIGGLHRSGTSLLHEILRSHPDISGFENTGVSEDEGQHLQSVYLPAKAFGGPGRFGFDAVSCMDEQHALATDVNAKRLYTDWSKNWDTTRTYLMEKSPPNLVRTRFFQKLFPRSSFIIILRHPIAVAYATQKWCETSIPSLLEHSLRCYERFLNDMPCLDKVYILRYEDFVIDPKCFVNDILSWIGIDPIQVDRDIQINVNQKYFKLWKEERSKLIWPSQVSKEVDQRAHTFGYSMQDMHALLPVSWLGAHNRTRTSRC